MTGSAVSGRGGASPPPSQQSEIGPRSVNRRWSPAASLTRTPAAEPKAGLVTCPNSHPFLATSVCDAARGSCVTRQARVGVRAGLLQRQPAVPVGQRLLRAREILKHPRRVRDRRPGGRDGDQLAADVDALCETGVKLLPSDVWVWRGLSQNRCLQAFREGETRTRTGDTTIFSRAVPPLERPRNPCKRARSERRARSTGSPQIPVFPRRFGRWQAVHLPNRGANVAMLRVHQVWRGPACQRQ
jgi:hypothetical protein